MPMELPVNKMIGWIIAGGIGVLAILNGTMMLISPKRWFELPDWLAGKGTLSAEKYSRGIGSIQIRILGAVVLGMVLWICYDAFVKHV